MVHHPCCILTKQELAVKALWREMGRQPLGEKAAEICEPAVRHPPPSPGLLDANPISLGVSASPRPQPPRARPGSGWRRPSCRLIDPYSLVTCLPSDDHLLFVPRPYMTRRRSRAAATPATPPAPPW